MAIRKIRIDGDPLLRKRSREVKEINERIITLIDDMLETMYDAEGVGLAAPQVGVLKRVIVVDIGEGPLMMINPVLKDAQGGVLMYEACLSIPEFSGVVNRPEKMTVEYTDKVGNDQKMEVEGFLARAICHEVDHLNGVLFKDKVIPEDKLPKEFIEAERAKNLDE